MSDDRRKTNKQSTGTVPKVKCRNNTSYSNERDSPRSWTNNLASDLHRLNLSDYLRNSRRNLPPPSNYCTMNTSTVEEQRHLNNPAVNGSITPNTSSSTSRRNSSGTVPKCDNITKYPDKRQIEDKLSQIREYLQITTSLMSSMKNTDDQLMKLSCIQLGDSGERNNLTQMIGDLRDSERKLVNILQGFDEIEDKNEQADGNDNYSEGVAVSHRNDADIHQMSLSSLQQKAENRLRDARQIQEKLMTQYDVNTNQRDKNPTSMQDFDAAIRELEERTKRLNEPRGGSNPNLQDKLLAEVDSLQSQIVNLHTINEDRNQLIQVLDNRDIELRAQHQELQSKLSELQSKKMQIDCLVGQLQNMEEGDEQGDVGAQVRRIVTMKDHLSKLKDMLEIVKTTESAVLNETQEEQESACDVCTKAENLLEKRRTPLPSSQVRYDKQSNKNATYDRHGFGGARPKGSSNADKMALHVELEAKKRELEEIMGKHKAGTSNLNHDVGTTDNKSEFSCSSNAYYDAPPWHPIMPDHNRFDSSESDDYDYSELNQPNLILPVLNYPQAKATDKPRSERDFVQDNGRLSSVPRTPERNTRSNSVTIGRSNSEQSNNKNQVQKQLELIRSVCDSMLEQQNQTTPNLQLRNNLTPNSIYSEPRRFASPNPHSMNVLANPAPPDLTPWASPPDPANYQGWLANNTLQTQAFMLNTLNQCCQMLWLQQRELMTLRQTVTQMQERVDYGGGSQSHLASSPGGENRCSRSNQKTNQVAAACSMPNLNQYNIPSVNLESSSYHQNNNMQNARLLDTCLNNASSISGGEHINNSVLHAVNANINQMQGQIWNGQALNNQVAPGNRANNYWDNFRSYSRQNLLSAKSNESNPFALISMSKSNSDHTSAATSQETTPHRRARSVRNSAANRNNASIPPVPDVVNHKTNDLSLDIPTAPLNPHHRNPNENDSSNLGYHYPNNAFSYNEISSNNSNVSEEQHIFKECASSENASRRNEWHEETNDEAQNTKSKLFEELRENVYKEVVTLISANETRPHFLIQLFRDLQMISSDPLRLKILQSIQTIITHSLISSSQFNRQELEQQQANEQIVHHDSGLAMSLQSTVWPKAHKNPNSRNALHVESESLDMQSVVKEIIPYLNDHEEDSMGHPFLDTLKQILIESESFQDAVRDSVFKKHFSNVLDEVLTQYHGKKVRDVKMHVIQTINDLLRGELSFIQLIQDTCPETCNAGDLLFDGVPTVNGQADNNGGLIQNGDLAEADQGRVEDDDVEEEGAVGGFWDLQLESPVVVSTEEVDLPAAVEFQNNTESQTQFIKQGLDQVPTRLPTKSRSNTPSKDRSSSRTDHPDQF